MKLKEARLERHRLSKTVADDGMTSPYTNAGISDGELEALGGLLAHETLLAI